VKENARQGLFPRKAKASRGAHGDTAGRNERKCERRPAKAAARLRRFSEERRRYGARLVRNRRRPAGAEAWRGSRDAGMERSGITAAKMWTAIVPPCGGITKSFGAKNFQARMPSNWTRRKRAHISITTLRWGSIASQAIRQSIHIPEGIIAWIKSP